MNMSFNLGEEGSQYVIVALDEGNNLVAHTFSDKNLYENELELADEAGSIILYTNEPNTT
mgnify:CR=1 FL=1